MNIARPFAPSYIFKSLLSVLPFLGITFAVVAGTIVLSSVIAVFLAKAKMSKNKFARGFASTYINILRCTPALVLLFIVFYGLPLLVKLIFHTDINFWPKIIFVIIALALLYSSTLAEIIRSAYESIGRGQYEAALSSGLTPLQATVRIMAPQALVVALPNLGNSLISLFKEGSLAYTIGLIDVMGAGNLFIARNYGGYAVETYIALAIIYWVITLSIEGIFYLLEKHFSKGQSHA